MPVWQSFIQKIKILISSNTLLQFTNLYYVAVKLLFRESVAVDFFIFIYFYVTRILFKLEKLKVQPPVKPQYIYMPVHLLPVRVRESKICNF